MFNSFFQFKFKKIINKKFDINKWKNFNLNIIRISNESQTKDVGKNSYKLAKQISAFWLDLNDVPYNFSRGFFGYKRVSGTWRENNSFPIFFKGSKKNLIY